MRIKPPDIRARFLITFCLSDDDRKPWYGGLVVDDRKKVFFPDDVGAENGRIYMVYVKGRTTDREILVATFQ